MRFARYAAIAAIATAAACQPSQSGGTPGGPPQKGGSGVDLFDEYGISTDPTGMTGLEPPPDCLWKVHLRDGQWSGYLCPGDPGYDDSAAG